MDVAREAKNVLDAVRTLLVILLAAAVGVAWAAYVINRGML
jgi:hypothetical protein